MEANNVVDLNLGTGQIPWRMIQDRMILVSLRFRYWRATKKLDIRNHLMGGVDAELTGEDNARTTYGEAIKEMITGGQRRLMPSDRLKAIKQVENAARRAIEDLTFNTALGRMMPRDNYDKLIARLTRDPWGSTGQSLQQRFYALRDQIVEERRTTLPSTIRSSYHSLAVGAWRMARGFPLDSPEYPPQVWLEEYLDAIIDLLPSAETIYESFGFGYELRTIEVPGDIDRLMALDDLDRARKAAEACERQARRSLENLRNRAALEAEREIASIDAQAARQRAQAELDRAEAEARQARLDLERADIDLRIQQDMERAARERLEEAIEPTLIEVTSGVRSVVYEAVVRALAATKKNGVLLPQSIGALKDVIQKARDLNWTNDEQVVTYLGQLETIVRNYSGKDVGDKAENALTILSGDLYGDLNIAGYFARGNRFSIRVPDEEYTDTVVARGSFRAVGSSNNDNVEVEFSVARGGRVREPE